MSEKVNKNCGFSVIPPRRPLILLSLIFVVCLAAVISIDASVSKQLMNWPENERRFFETLARMGESDWMLIPTLIVWGACTTIGFAPITYRFAWIARSIGAMSGYIFLSVAIPGATAALLKVMIGRARPIFIDSLGVFHFTPFAGDWRHAGFPSGHTTTAFAFAFALGAMFGRKVGIFAFLGATLIGISRIVDGAHYLSDVIVGAMLGTFGAFLVLSWFVHQGWIFRKNGNIQNRMLPLIGRMLKRRSA